MKRDIERRRPKRVASTARAYIVDSDSCVTGCKLIDLSHSGARIEVPQESKIKSEFALYIPSKGIDRQVEVVWRSGNQLGVFFVMTTPDCATAPTSSQTAAPKPISIDQLRTLARNSTSVEPIPQKRTVGGWLEAEATSRIEDAWRQVRVKFENTVEIVTRIIDGKGHAVSADAGPRDEISSGDPAAVEASTVRQPETDLELFHWSDLSDEDLSWLYESVDPAFDHHAHLDDGAHEESHSHAESVSYGNADHLAPIPGDARLRLRSGKNTALDVTIAAIVIVGILAVYFIRPRESAVSPADHNADIATAARTTEVDANPLPATGANITAVAAIQAGEEAQRQQSTVLPQNPGNDGEVFAAQANASPPHQDTVMFMQPNDMLTIPAAGSETFAKPGELTSEDAQAALLPAPTAGQVAAPPIAQTSVSLGAAKTAPTDANLAPKAESSTLPVASARADADTVSQLTSTPSVKPASDVGAGIASVTGPANLLLPRQDDSLYQQSQRMPPTPVHGGEPLSKPANMDPIWVQNAPLPDLNFGRFASVQTLQTIVPAPPSSSPRDRTVSTNRPSEDVLSFELPKVPARAAAESAYDTAAGGTTYAASVASPPRRTVQADTGITRQLNLGIGKSVIVDLPRDAVEVVVANPSIANAVVHSSRRLYVIAMASGQTTVFAMDEQGRQIATIEISVGRDIAELDRILKMAMPGSNIVLRTVNDTIILTGEVDSAGEAQKALDIAAGFVSQANAAPAGGGGGAGGGGAGGTGTSTVVSVGASTQSADGKVINSLVIRGRDQVMLKVTVAEVQRQVLKQLGITNSIAIGSWGAFQQQNGLPLNMQALTSGATTFGRGSLQATLTAFERDGVARVLAEPTVTAVSGESAKFTAGGEIPIPQNETCPPPGTAGYCSVGVTYKDYGVTLNFTPVVLSEGRILLRVATEVTEVDPQQSVQFQNINVPGFRTRKNETSVELPSGGSIISAGLIQVQSQQVMNGLPGLMNLPVLGQLFRSRDYQRQETELMIIVTPYIAKPVGPNEVARPTDGFADASDPQAALLGHVNRIYSTKSSPTIIQNFDGRVGFIND